MNQTVKISAFLLERYHIGEVSNDEKTLVETALARNPALAANFADLDRSDREFKQRFPRERFLSAVQNTSAFPYTGKAAILNGRKTAKARFRPSLVWGLSAAAMLFVIALPLFVLMNPARDTGVRIKGASNSVELSVYLKGNSAGEDVKLPDQADIHTGNTVQLAYRVQTPGERYGVIFSIDGRALVTLHYPYSPEQSTRLISGKAVPLEEAYTLDDAPDYEMFFFVVGDKPLEAAHILDAAQKLALKITKKPQTALQQGSAAFKGCELQILTLRK